MTWTAISYVTSGITLAAFIVAVAAWLYKASLQRRERLIQTAPEADRAKLVDSALEFFQVDTGGLTKHQKFQLAIEQIQARERRFQSTIKIVAFIAVLLSGVTVYAISADRPTPPHPENPDKPVPAGEVTGRLLRCPDDDEDKWWQSKAWRVESNDGNPFHGFHKTLSASEPPYNAPSPGRSGILAMHPPAEDTPAILRMFDSSQKKILSFEASGSPHGDAIVRAFVDGMAVGRPIQVDGKRWYTLNFPLPENRQPNTSIELRIQAGGAKNWNFETVFIDCICLL